MERPLKVIEAESMMDYIRLMDRLMGIEYRPNLRWFGLSLLLD